MPNDDDDDFHSAGGSGVAYGEARRASLIGPIDVFISKRLTLARFEMGVSQDKMAADLGITRNQLYRWERAKERLMAARLARVAAYCGRTMDWFIAGFPLGDDRAAKAATEEAVALGKLLTMAGIQRLARLDALPKKDIAIIEELLEAMEIRTAAKKAMGEG